MSQVSPSRFAPGETVTGAQLDAENTKLANATTGITRDQFAEHCAFQRSQFVHQNQIDTLLIPKPLVSTIGGTNYLVLAFADYAPDEGCEVVGIDTTDVVGPGAVRLYVDGVQQLPPYVIPARTTEKRILIEFYTFNIWATILVRLRTRQV